MQKLLLIIGLVCLVLALLWPWLEKSGLGRLPGDIVIEGEHSQVYFPIVTCLIISVVLSAVLWFFNR